MRLLRLITEMNLETLEQTTLIEVEMGGQQSTVEVDPAIAELFLGQLLSKELTEATEVTETAHEKPLSSPKAGGLKQL